jgi:hypothetical protein
VKVVVSGLKLIIPYLFKHCIAMPQTMPLAALTTTAEAKPNPERKK